MKLEWMGEYRDIVEQLIKYCNVYAAVYKKEEFMGTDIPISYAQIQIIEYLLENEELHLNMKQQRIYPRNIFRCLQECWTMSS